MGYLNWVNPFLEFGVMLVDLRVGLNLVQISQLCN